MNIKPEELDDDEKAASKYMTLRMIHGLVGYLRELPVEGNEYLN